MIESLRNSLQPILTLVAKPLSIFPANIISLGIFIVAAPGFYFYAKGDALLGSLFILGAAFDGIDGTVARLRGEDGKFGGVLDATLDRVFDGLVLFFIGLGGLVRWEILFLAYIASITVSYVKAKAETVVKSSSVGKNQFSVGFAQRGDRILIIFLGSIANGLWSEQDNEILTAAIIYVLITSIITSIWRFIVIEKALR